MMGIKFNGEKVGKTVLVGAALTTAFFVCNSLVSCAKDEKAATDRASTQIMASADMQGNILTARIQDRTYRLITANQIEFQSGQMRYVFDYATKFAVVQAQDLNTTRILSQEEMPSGGQWNATKDIGCALVTSPAARTVTTAQQFKQNFC